MTYVKLHLRDRVKSGEIAEPVYEKEKLRLCHLYSYLPDWFVWNYVTDQWEIHECKGGRIEPGAYSKLRIAAALYPEMKFFLCRGLKGGKVWKVTEIPNHPPGRIKRAA